MRVGVARCAMCYVGTRGRKLLGDRARSGATYGHPADQLPNLANPRRRPTLWGRASQHYGGEPPSVWGEPPSSMWGRASHSMLFPACRGEHVVSAQWGRASQNVSTMGASLPECLHNGGEPPRRSTFHLGGLRRPRRASARGPARRRARCEAKRALYRPRAPSMGRRAAYPMQTPCPSEGPRERHVVPGFVAHELRDLASVLALTRGPCQRAMKPRAMPPQRQVSRVVLQDAAGSSCRPRVAVVRTAGRPRAR